MLSESTTNVSLSEMSVLVVEDEFFLADDICGAIAAADGRVIGPAGEIGEARRLIAEEGPGDFVVLDINLKGEMAFDLADELAGSDIPFVFATGYDHQAIPERFRHVPHWQKPFELAGLLENLRAVRRLSRS